MSFREEPKMPRYEFKCASAERKYTISIQISDYKPEIECPCGIDGCLAKRVFNMVSVTNGLTANEKKFGTTTNRREMADYMKDQKKVRKNTYDPNSREAKSNDIWTGKEGLDGVTSMPIQRKQ